MPDPTPYCTCAEHGVTMLDDLLAALAAGEDQVAASRRLWGQAEAQKKPRPGPRRHAAPTGADESAAKRGQ